MKKFFHILTLMLLVAACLSLWTCPVRAQVAPTTQIVLTTSTTGFAASATTTCTSQVFRSNSLTGFAVVPNFVLSGTNTGAVTFGFAPSLDGSTFATTTPLSVVCTATGTTAVIDYINVAPYITGSGVANAPYWRLKNVVNSTGTTGTINSITISKSNR